MTSVRVRIVRFVDDAVPGFVACELVDVQGVIWSLIDKVPVVTTELLDANSAYPRATSIACEVIERSRTSDGRDVVHIDTARPWSIEATGGETQFWVSAELIEEP
jgi:hypothetical protein